MANEIKFDLVQDDWAGKKSDILDDAKLKLEVDKGSRITFSGAYVICPDLFGLRHLGEADGWRGRLVRRFAWLLDRVAPR